MSLAGSVSNPGGGAVLWFSVCVFSEDSICVQWEGGAPGPSSLTLCVCVSVEVETGTWCVKN